MELEKILEEIEQLKQRVIELETTRAIPKLVELGTVKNIYQVDLSRVDEINQDIIFEKGSSLVFIDIATEEKYRVYIDSGYLLTEKI